MHMCIRPLFQWMNYSILFSKASLISDDCDESNDVCDTICHDHKPEICVTVYVYSESFSLLRMQISECRRKMARTKKPLIVYDRK